LHYDQISDELFKEYIDMWLEIKQEASGFSEQVNTEEEKDAYIKRFHEKENILLDKNSIIKNSERRFIAKIMLNSFWGKLSQRPNFPKVEICKNYDQYWKIVNDDLVKVLGEYEVNDETIILCYKMIDENDCLTGNTNIAVASFVTTYARLHLYKFMEEVLQNGNDRLLYFDTDSILYIKRDGDIDVETSECLGDLTNEITDGYGIGSRGIRFCSAGTKNYAFEVLKPDQSTEVVLKTEGIKKYSKDFIIA